MYIFVYIHLPLCVCVCLSTYVGRFICFFLFIAMYNDILSILFVCAPVVDFSLSIS